jgi:hypothetical protein
MVHVVGYIGEKLVYASGGSVSTQPPVNTSPAPQNWSPTPQNYVPHPDSAAER